MHRRYSESEATAVREEERASTVRQNSVVPDATMEEGPPRCSQEMEDVFYPFVRIFNVFVVNESLTN